MIYQTLNCIDFLILLLRKSSACYWQSWRSWEIDKNQNCAVFSDTLVSFNTGYICQLQIILIGVLFKVLAVQYYARYMNSSLCPITKMTKINKTRVIENKLNTSINWSIVTDMYYGTRLRYLAVEVNTTMDVYSLGYTEGLPVYQEWQDLVASINSAMPPSLQGGFHVTKDLWHWLHVQEVRHWEHTMYT